MADSQQLPRRFCLFGGPDYYPSGGWHDFQLSRSTLEDAKRAAEELSTGDNPKLDWWQIFDAQERRVVAQSKYQGFGAPMTFPDMDK
jgi:hypothetical protein